MDADTFDGEDYWNSSNTTGFSFHDIDEEEKLPETFQHRRLIAEDEVSEISLDVSILSELPISSVLSDEDLRQILDEQCLRESPIKKGISPEKELKLLRRKVQESIHPPPAEVTANRLLLGKKCSLEAYKSIHEKEQLLDEVISTGNGDGILNVVLFLSRTLNKRMLNMILRTRPEACDHYLNYLILRMKISEAIDILTMLGREQEAAMLQFKIASDHQHYPTDPQIKKQRLKKVFSDYFASAGTLSLYSKIVASAINLLEWQLLVKTKDEKFSSHIIGSSSIESLFYACTKFSWKDGNSSEPCNPFKLASDHEISSGLLEWTLLNERAQSQAYMDLQGIFEKSSWYLINQRQFSINIPLEAAIKRLYCLEAPPPVLSLFLSKISDLNKRLELAKKVKSVRTIIDTLTALKDKQELEEYKNNLPEGSEERFYAEKSLKNLSKKWSTEGIKLY